MSFVTELTAIVTSLDNVATTYVRDDIPDTTPTSAYIILDIVPTTTTQGLDGPLYDDLAIQVSAWHPTGFAAAIDLAEAARARMEALEYFRSQSPQLQRDESWRGVLVTYTKQAAHDTFA